jgi:photosystem II stability/assembly factor-like uncharacterized protein
VANEHVMPMEGDMKHKKIGLSIGFLFLIPLLSMASAGRLNVGTVQAEEAIGLMDAPLEKEAPSPELTLTLTPYNPPIVIPATGGTFQSAIEVKNNGTPQAVFDVWTSITRPDGTKVDPAAGPFRVQSPGGWSASRDDLSQELTASDPPGIYTFSAHVRLLPGRSTITESFTFEKLAGGGWFPQSSGTSDWLFAVHFADEDNGWAVGQTNAIVHTTNGGDVWTPQSPPIFSNLWSVFAADGQNAWAGGSGAVMLHTEDGGEHWVQQDTGASATNSWEGLFFLDANNGWAVGGKPFDFTSSRRVILHTTNGGSSWQAQYSVANETPLNAVYFVDANNGWAVGDGTGILHTTNGGTTWVNQSSGTGDYLEDVYFTDTNNGWAVGHSGKIIHTVNGGATWVPQDLGIVDNLTGVHFTDADQGWIVGADQNFLQGVIWHTDDGGASWHPQDAGSASYLYDLVFTDANNGWAAGGNGTIIHTETGGE